MNEEIEDLMNEIELLLEKYNDSNIELKYKLIITKDDEVKNGKELLSLNDNYTIKINIITKLIELKDYMKSAEYALERIKLGHNDVDLDEKELERLYNITRNNEDLTIKEYKNIKAYIEEHKQNSVIVNEKKELIVPKKKIFLSKVSPKEFEKQFGRLPYGTDKDLKKYDLSSVDYSKVKLDSLNFSGTNFRYELENNKSKIIRACNFEDCNLNGIVIKSKELLFDNFNNSGVIINPKCFKNEDLRNMKLSHIDMSSEEYMGFYTYTLYNTDLSYSDATLKPRTDQALDNCKFDGLDLSKTEFNNCIIKGTSFKNTNARIIIETIRSEYCTNTNTLEIIPNKKIIVFHDLSNCNFIGCIIVGKLDYCYLRGTKLPYNNNYVINTTMICKNLENFESNGAILDGSLDGFNLRGAKIAHSRAVINQNKILNKDLSNGDYRGCIFKNTDFDDVNTNGSLFDEEILEIINAKKKVR